MSFLNQQSVDDLLAKVQSQASDISAEASSAAPADSSPPVLGDMESPDALSAEERALAGEFAPPPRAVPKDTTNPFASEFQRLMAIEVPVIVQLGQRRMTVGEVMRLGVGAIIEFSKSADDELELLANNKPIGRGHAVKVGENFGIKIVAVGSVRETIRKLGGALAESA